MGESVKAVLFDVDGTLGDTGISAADGGVDEATSAADVDQGKPA